MNTHKCICLFESFYCVSAANQLFIYPYSLLISHSHICWLVVSPPLSHCLSPHHPPLLSASPPLSHSSHLPFPSLLSLPAPSFTCFLLCLSYTISASFYLFPPFLSLFMDTYWYHQVQGILVSYLQVISEASKFCEKNSCCNTIEKL